MPVGLRVTCSTAANTHKNERLHERGTSEEGMESASARDMLDRPSQEAGSVLSTAKVFWNFIGIRPSPKTQAGRNFGSGPHHHSSSRQGEVEAACADRGQYDRAPPGR